MGLPIWILNNNMNLTIDIGNTLAKIGVFKGSVLKDKLVLPDWEDHQILDFLTNQKVTNVILSNVTGVSIDKLISALKHRYNLLLLTEQTPLPINNLYRTPKTLGKDRIAAVVGASQLFPKENLLVIDAGTCITYDWLKANGAYVGGNISPGLQMRLQAMHHFTGKLPLLGVEDINLQIGDSTKSAMLNGAIHGLILEINGFINVYQSDFEKLKVVLTGGNAEFLAKKLKKQIFVNQNLVLIGLNKILDYNASPKA